MGRQHVLGDGDDEIRNNKGSRESQAQNSGQGLDDANAASGGEGEGEEGHQQEGQGDGCRDDSEGEVHGSIVAGADVGIGYQIRRISPQRTRRAQRSLIWLIGSVAVVLLRVGAEAMRQFARNRAARGRVYNRSEVP